MMRNQRLTILKTFLGVIICIIMVTNMSSYVLYNGSTGGYEDPEESTESSFTYSEINAYIEKGSGYYLQSYSDFLIFSRLFEIQNQDGIDSDQWMEILDSSISNIRLARDMYLRLIQVAENTPYNWRVIYSLWFFNYYDFMIKNGLIRDIFIDVERYLSIGDITGTYYKMYSDTKKIESMLLEIKNSIISTEKSELIKLWNLNEKFSKTLTFGQYVTRIFYEINNEEYK